MRDMEHGHGDGIMPVWAVITAQFVAVLFGWFDSFFHVSSEWVKDFLPFLQLVSLVLAITLAIIKLLGKDSRSKEKEE